MAGVAEMIAAARAGIENLRPAELSDEMGSDRVVLVDVREPYELGHGVIPGATVVPRGMLEFYADPSTPYHLESFTPDRRIIVYCAAGARSALAARSLQELGFLDVAHLDGGFRAWVEDERPVRPAPEIGSTAAP